MGSTTIDLLDASSPSLIVARATEKECIHTWTLTHPKWGPALTLDDYLRRESYLATVPLAKDGGLTQWILTDATLPPDQRPILSSCESLIKPAVACDPRGVSGDSPPAVIDGVVHGVASVFTDPKYRGKGYASRMLRELGVKLRQSGSSSSDTCQADTDADLDAAAALTKNGRVRGLFSVLYSDIGKAFYAKHGWAPFASAHLALQPSASPTANGGGETGGSSSSSAEFWAGRSVRLLGYHELAELSAADERRLRADLPRRAQATGKTAVAIVPGLDALLWHLMREDYMAKHIFGRTPEIRGALYGDPETAGRRVWAIWTRGYYGGLETTKGNNFHILRFVVEDEDAPDAYLVEGIRAILQLAQAQASEWRSEDIQMWNPSPRLRELVAKTGLAHELVDRDNSSIASLMWYGEEPTAELDWVMNEKYAWC